MARGRVTIGALPDGVLLDIFEFYMSRCGFLPKFLPLRYQCKNCQWYPLVHVCQRWRYLVFASPRRLDLCLYCTDSTHVREKLDIWPPLPIKIWSESPNLGDNIIAALETPNRVREISLWRIRSPLDRLVTTLQEPFPELESLSLQIDGATMPVLPNTFLGGSAPRLRSLQLDRIPFPTLPRLLLSCNGLVDLTLSGIPLSGYISSEAMATSIFTLTKLSFLSIIFDSPTSLPDWTTQRPPLLTRASATLPSLTQFWFCGVSEYLEDLVARINAPLLCVVNITLFKQPVFGTQQLIRFISHPPMFISYNQAKIDFEGRGVSINCSSIDQYSGYLKLCIEGDLQVLSMAHICNQFSFLVSRIERLYIQAPPHLLTRFRVDILGRDTHCLELFHSFTAAKALYLHRPFQSLIMSALRGLSEESVTDLLPALVDLYLEYQLPGSEMQDIESFITARQHTGHPVVVRFWVGY